MRKVSNAERHFVSDAAVPAKAVGDFASAATSTKNFTSNMPSCPLKRTALRGFIEAAAGIGKGERHDWPAALSYGTIDGAPIRALRRSALRWLRDNMMRVASDRLRPVMATPSPCAGIPEKTS